MLIKLGPDGLHWTKRPEGQRMLAEERKRLEHREAEILREIKKMSPHYFYKEGGK